MHPENPNSPLKSRTSPKRRGQLVGYAAAGLCDSSQQLNPTTSTGWLPVEREGPLELIPQEASMA